MSNFVIGFGVALAIEFTKLINKRVRKRMIVEGLIFSIFGGFFVVLLDPKNTLNAIIGAAWDRVLLSQLKGYFGNSRKDGI